MLGNILGTGDTEDQVSLYLLGANVLVGKKAINGKMKENNFRSLYICMLQKIK